MNEGTEEPEKKQQPCIRVLNKKEVSTAIEWAAAEGWNPGLNDLQSFTSVDKEGFIGLFLGEILIGTISAINYNDTFSFLGFYIVHKQFRGKGYGCILWQAGMQHAGDRVVGLDGGLC
jgi:hypothetical protein